MPIMTIFINNLIRILGQRNLSLAWIEQETGVNEVLLNTFKYIATGLSFKLVLNVAIALGVTIDSLIDECMTTTLASYGSDTAEILYERFWRNVFVIAEYEGVDKYELADVAGKTIAGLVICYKKGKDIDVQRADAIALHMGGLTLDSLVNMHLDWRHPSDAGDIAANY